MIGQAVEAAVHTVMERAKVPGIVLAVARGDGPAEVRAFGADAAGRPLAPETLFSVASISKTATALAVLRLVERGLLHLDDPLSDHIPQAAAAQPGVTLRTLLCHTSGMPTDVDQALAPYAPGLDWPTLAAACVATELETPPLTRVQYSNAGFGLLAVVVERATGEAFADALAELVLRPLGIEGYLGVEPPRPPAVIADVRGDRARDPALEPHNSPFYRSLALPWAGLVTTIDGALRVIRAFAGTPGNFLTPEMRAEATTSQTDGLAGGAEPPLRWNPCPWGLGAEIRGTKTPHWTPPAASPESFGHSGGSGCLAWYDPARDIAWAYAGARSADSGWLIRRAPAIADALLND